MVMLYKTRPQWFANPMVTLTSLTLSVESWQEVHKHCNCLYFTTNVNRSNKRPWFHIWKKKTIFHRNWLTYTSQMIYLFSLIRLPKLNPWCIGGIKQQEVLASTWTQIKQGSCILNNMAPISVLNGKLLKQVDQLT